MKRRHITNRLALIVFILLEAPLTMGQKLTLQQCYDVARELSPVHQQKLYYESIAHLKEKNASQLNYPDIRLNGLASYQSDVFSIPFSPPNTENPEIPKDRYQLAFSLNQRIYDGGQAKRTREVALAEAKLNEQQVTVTLYQIKEVINHLFFGALITQENEKILDTLKVTLVNQLNEVESRVRNGVLLASNANILKKEILTTEQQLIEVRYNKKALLLMLAAWIEREVPQTTLLEIPVLKLIDSQTLAINRPEMTLLDLQAQHIEANRNLLAINNYPKLSAFADGGLSRPNPYNFFETDLSGFYIAGIKLQWNILDWGRNKNDLKILDLQNQIVISNKDDFERGVSIALLAKRSDIQKLKAMIEKDQEILTLQEEIVKESYAQLKNGLITSTQYIIELNNQTRARISTRIHELNLIQTEADILVKSGNS